MYTDRERWRRNRKANLQFEIARAELAKPGARLVQNLSRRRKGFTHLLEPSGHLVEDEVAARLKAFPGVVAGNDGLFPGTDQTWHLENSNTTNG